MSKDLIYKDLIYKDLIAFHPGNYVSEIVDDLNITQNEFANRVGISSKTISKIINHEDDISPDTANKLARVTGISIQTWLNLQAQYEAKLQEIKNAQNNDEVDIANSIDTKYLKQQGFLEDRRYSSTEKIEKLRQILKMGNLTQLMAFNPAVSYRRAATDDDRKSIIGSNTMLELATDEARDKSDIRYTKQALIKKKTYLRKLVSQPPEIFYPKLKAALLECGIVLVAMPHIPGARLNGATKRFKNGSVLLLFTDRNKYADTIWFSIIHELGHIYYEDFYTDYKNHDEYVEKEKRADKFATDFFIPEEQYHDFVQRSIFTREAVVKFANEIGVIPGIIVGRLQSDSMVDYTKLNELRVKYKVTKRTK